VRPRSWRAASRSSRAADRDERNLFLRPCSLDPDRNSDRFEFLPPLKGWASASCLSVAADVRRRLSAVVDRLRRVPPTPWVGVALVLGGVIVLLRAFWDVSGIDERLARDLTIHVALPALLAARFGGDIGWRIDRTAVRGAALFAAFVTPFYVVGSTLPTGREYCPMWTTALTVSPFLPHAVQPLVVAFAAETCYRGLLCVGVRDRGSRCVPISPGVYALMHTGKPPVELLQSGPTDVLFDAVDSVDGGPRLWVRSPGLPRVARPRPAARPRPRDTWLAPRPAPSALLTLYGNRGNLFFDGSRRGRMSFQLTAEHEAVREAVREFGAAEIAPVAREHDETGRYPEDIRRKAAELDLVSPHIPVEYGGAGMDAVGRTVVTEELWRADPGIGSAVGSAGFGSSMLLEYGDEWMKEEWLPRIASGESASCSCISEPGHGSNVAGMETTAERDGDGYVINGNKMWITNGTVADVAVVMAKTDPAADPPHRGITPSWFPPRPTASGRRRSTTSSVSVPPIWPRSSSTTSAFRPTTSSGPRTRGSTS
jgi:hypothetical protein